MDGGGHLQLKNLGPAESRLQDWLTQAYLRYQDGMSFGTLWSLMAPAGWLAEMETDGSRHNTQQLAGSHCGQSAWWASTVTRALRATAVEGLSPSHTQDRGPGKEPR